MQNSGALRRDIAAACPDGCLKIKSERRASYSLDRDFSAYDDLPPSGGTNRP